MKKEFVITLAVSALAGCAAVPATVAVSTGTGAGVGAVAGNVIGAVAGVDRTAATIAGAAIGGAIGYQRAKRMEAKAAEREAAALRSESGFNPSLSTETITQQEDSGQSNEVAVLKSLEMQVGQDEMLTPAGTLHPRAARALARMNNMVVEHGGEFAVYVPSTQMGSVDAIKAVAPQARIYEAGSGSDYRLVVVPATAG